MHTNDPAPPSSNSYALNIDTQLDRLNAMAHIIIMADHTHDDDLDALACMVYETLIIAITDVMWSTIYDSDPEQWIHSRHVAEHMVAKCGVHRRMWKTVTEAIHIWESAGNGEYIPGTIKSALRNRKKG